MALSGPLGAGKTTFVKAVVAERLGSDLASSPTFTFWHRYGAQGAVREAGEPPIDHLDLYRIDEPRDLDELGLEEAFTGESIVLVEWWDNAPALLPPDRYEVAIDGMGALARRVTVRHTRECGT